jgi:multiple sugar transport system substrate-binding protein
MVACLRACGWLAVFIGTVLWAGCREASRPDGRIRLRLSGYAGNPAETDLMRELVADFNASQHEVVARYEPVPGQYYPKLLTMLASKTAPDVFYLDILYFQPFLAKRSILRPLDDLIASSSIRVSDFIPSLVSAFSDQGKVYGIPKDFNTLGLYYNRESFERAGLAPPDEGWDLARFREAAKRLTRPQGPAPRYGFAMPPDNADRFLPIAAMFGASLYAPDGSCAIASPQGVQALTFYAGLRRTDQVAIFPSEVGSSWTGDAFGRAQAAMVFEGSWLTPYLAESFPKLGYGVTQLPRGPVGRSNFLFTVAYVIPQSAQHPEAAWKLISYLTSEAAQERITFALPSRTAVSTRFVAKHPAYRPILAAAAYAKPYAFGPRGNRVYDRLGLAMQEVLLGIKSPQQALVDAAAAIDRINRL